MRSPASASLRRRRFQDPAIFWPVVAVTLGTVVVAQLLSPLPLWLPGLVVVVAVVGLGIPHGSVDHLVGGARDEGTRKPGRFAMRYLLAMSVAGLAWLLSPELALAGFLVLSVHHFGQSDLAYLAARDRASMWLLQWSRGIFLVGLPLVAHPDGIAPVVQRLGGGDPAEWGWLAGSPWLWSLLLIGQHALVGCLLAGAIGEPASVRRECVAVAVLSLLFIATHPLIGFALYFGLWHSLAHLLVLADVVATPPGSLRCLTRLAAPLTTVSVAGLALSAAAVAITGRTDLVVPVAFLLISVVTLPHTFVVEQLWRVTNPSSDGVRQAGRSRGRLTASRASSSS